MIADADRTVKSFINYLKHEVGASPNTTMSYGRDLKCFLEWSTSRKVVRWDDWTVRDLGEYAASLAENGLSPATIGRRVASLKTFFRFLVLEESIKTSPAELLNRPGAWDRVPNVLNGDQVDKLRAAAPTGDKLYLRDSALLHLISASGMRVSEVAELKLVDVDVERRFCRCVGKGNKQRIVPFDETAAEALERYLKRLRPLLDREASTDRLFLTRRGAGMTRIDVWKLIKASAKNVGIEGKVSPHTLRHSFATRMLAEGADLRVIQELLGHSNISTTQHYTRVDASRLKKIHERFHPRG